MRVTLGTCIGLLSLGWSSFAEINPKEVDLYHRLLSNTEDIYLVEILSEGAKRELPLPKDLTPLWKKPRCRSVLLQSMTLSDLEKLKLLEPKVYSALENNEKSAIWLRANQMTAWSSSDKILNLGASVYDLSPKWAKDLILSIHIKSNSKVLLSKISQTAMSDTELAYSLGFVESVDVEMLSYVKGDSSFRVRQKLAQLQKLSKEDQAKVLASYEKVSAELKVQIVPFYKESNLLALLKKSEDEAIKAVALQTLFSAKWLEGQAERVLKGDSWSEAQVLYQYLLDHPDRITAESFDKYWTLSSKVGHTLLSAFLWKHPKEEVSKTLREQVDQSEDKTLALKALYALPAHGQSEWMKGHLKAKKWEADLQALAMDTLWKWKEVPEDRFYVEIFLDQGYRAGGPGMESLLKLMGLSKHKQAVKLIASFFKEVEEPVVEVDVAIEASGWHGSEEFSRSLKKFVRDGNTDIVLKWAVERCDGKDVPFPVVESLERNLNPYFFYHINARN